MASLFKDVKPPFGKYYISGSGNNCIITVFDTKVVFESLYNNKYTKLELTNPPTSLKDKGYDGSYTFAPVNIGFYNITITIFYAPSVRGLELPYITILYQNISTSRIDNFESVKGVNQNPPPWFIQPSPITTQPPIQPSPITQSLFKDVKPPFGKYYISSGSNNSLITVSDTKVVFESLYNNQYTFTELTNPPTSYKDKGYDGTYTFTPVNIGSYNIIITIIYARGVPGFDPPFISLSYQNLSTLGIINFESVKGVNQNPPPGFIQPSPITQPPIQPSPITQSLFKDVKPPFGKYYISKDSNNFVITVSDTKVVFESVYNNEYTKLELTNPPTSLKDKGINGSYNFAPVNIGSYNITISIRYAPSVSGYQEPSIAMTYVNSSTGMLVSSFVSAKGVNQNPPPGFIQPSPITTQPPIQPSPITHSPITPSPITTQPPIQPSPITHSPITPSPITSTPTTKSFFNEYFIYIGIVIFFMIISIGAYFFIINRKPTIQTISKNK